MLVQQAGLAAPHRGTKRSIIENKLAPAKEDEIETLETNDINQTELSRLSCQIELKEEFNNITVTMAIPRTLNSN